MLPAVEKYTTAKFRRWTLGKFAPAPSSFVFRFFSLDWTGSIVLLATITCLLLPLQWGANKYAWKSGVIIGLFCAFAALVIIFVLYEWKFAGPSCILPLRMFKNRTQVGACLAAFFLMFVMLVGKWLCGGRHVESSLLQALTLFSSLSLLLLGLYYIPIYYQASRGVTATKSGIDILPFMLALVLASGVAGGVITKFGRYWPFLVFSPVFICVGGGLLYSVSDHVIFLCTSLASPGSARSLTPCPPPLATRPQINEFTPNTHIIGFQILIGLGVGGCLQQTIIAIQADVTDHDDIPQATALVTFTQLIGGTVGLAIASTFFSTHLASALHEFAPDAPFDLVRNSVEAIATLPKEQQAGVIHAYVVALKIVFIISVPAGGLSILSALLVRNLSVKGKDLMAGGA